MRALVGRRFLFPNDQPPDVRDGRDPRCRWSRGVCSHERASEPESNHLAVASTFARGRRRQRVTDLVSRTPHSSRVNTSRCVLREHSGIAGREPESGHQECQRQDHEDPGFDPLHRPKVTDWLVDEADRSIGADRAA
jgi:hypothetical protein